MLIMIFNNNNNDNTYLGQGCSWGRATPAGAAKVEEQEATDQETGAGACTNST